MQLRMASNLESKVIVKHFINIKNGLERTARGKVVVNPSFEQLSKKGIVVEDDWQLFPLNQRCYYFSSGEFWLAEGLGCISN